MITKYDIAFENKNTVLIVNLDFYYEFSSFDYKGYAKNLKEEILKIARKHNAKKVKIVVGGVLLSTLILSPTNIESEHITNFITKDTVKESFNEVVPDINEDIIIIDVSKPKEEVINNNSNNNSNNKLNINTQIETVIKPSTQNNSTNKNNHKTEINTNTENYKNNQKIESNINNKVSSSENNEDIQKEEIIDNNIYVTIYRNNGSIIKLELEEYLIGVVGSEIPASFNVEALKAQAIVARTYALKRINEGKTLTDTVSTQVYKDDSELKLMWGNEFDKYYSKVKNAIMSTKGIVLIYNNNYIDAVYHSTSNGKTEDAIYVWGNDIPYLKSVDSKTDLNASSYKREITFTLEKLSNILNTPITKYTDIYLERNTSGRVSNVKINDIEIKGTVFRSLLGLRSTDFTIELTDENAIITTYGYGHGVGMSQYGANGLANLGYTYEQILKHYYQNINLKSI